MHRIFSNTQGPRSASMTLVGDNSMRRGLVDTSSGSLYQDNTRSSGDIAAQRGELSRGIDDILGVADDWDDEEDVMAEGGRGEESGRLRENHGSMSVIDRTSQKTNQETLDRAQSVSGKQQVSQLDDMDDSLFGSFSLNQSRKMTRKTTASNRETSLSVRQSTLDRETRAPQSTLDRETRAPQSTLERTNTATDSQANASNAAMRPGKVLPEKQTAESDDDDLFSLLVEEKEDSSRVKSRPKFRMKPKASHQTSSAPLVTMSNTAPGPAVVKPLPTADEQQEPANKEPEGNLLSSWEAGDRPKSRKGCANLPERVATLPATVSTPSSSNTGPDILTLDEVPGSEGERSKEKSVAGTVMRGSEEAKKVKGSHISSGIDVGDEDNILSGLGLDDSRHKQKADDLFRKKMPSRVSESPVQLSTQILGSESATKSSDVSGKSTFSSNAEDEGSSVFGGYVPSVVSGPRRLGLPSTTTTTIKGRRSNRALETSSHSVRRDPPQTDPEPKKTVLKHQLDVPVAEQLKTPSPSEVTGRPAKKTVRFAESEPSSTAGHQSEAEVSHNPVLATGRVRGERQEVDSEVKNPQQTEAQQSGNEREVKQNESEHKQLEHPVFPWQKRGKSDSSAVASPLRERVADKYTDAPELKEEIKTPSTIALSSEPTPLPDRHGIREQDQSLDSMKSPNSLQHSANTGLVGRERGQPEDLKAKVKALEHQLEVSEQQQQSLKEKAKTLVAGEKTMWEGRLQTKDLELTIQLEELRAKLHRLECERDQLQHSMETMKTYHTEDLAARDKSHSDRIQALEESFHRREEKWKEELEVQASHQKERLEQLERDKTDSVLAVRKKMESLELSKTNDMAQLQETHKSAVADMKREHELDLHRVKELHRQEVEALKAAHSHTQRLSELTCLVEEATRGVSGLQNRVEQAQREGLGVSQNNIQIHLQHLKTLEERLNRQSRDIESERELLHSLAGSLETHLSLQTQAVESERWSIQQERAKLKAEERAFEEKRITSLARLEQERRELMESKEKFLVEQQRLLSECLNERHSLASERAQLTVQQKEVSETEKRETQRRQMMEASLAKVCEEQAQLASRAASLWQEESKVNAESLHIELERKTVKRDRASLAEQRSQLEHREEEANKLNQSAVALQRESEETMQAVRREKTALAGQAEAMKRQRQELDDRETQLASERLAFARECRVLRDSHLSVSDDPNPVLTSTQWLDGSLPPPSPPLLPDIPTLTHSLPLPLTQDGHMQQQKQIRPDRDVTSALLSSLKHSRRLVAWDKTQDELDLQKEREFLESVQHQNSSLLSDHFIRMNS